MRNRDLVLTLHPQHYRPPQPLKPLNKSVSHSRRKRMTSLPSVSGEYSKPKVVLFYKNGDRNFRGSHVTVTPRRFRNFDNLLNELTRITNLSQGARYIFTPDTGTRIASLDELSDGKSYVCGSYPKLKKINYNHAPDGSKLQDKKKPNRNFTPAHMAPKLETEKPQTNIKPKIIHVIRNGVSVNRKVTKILLNKRTAQTYEQVLNDITATVGVVSSGFVRKLYNKHGKLVVNLSELFGEDDVFIAVGSEKFRPSDIPTIIEEAGLGKSTTKSHPSLRTASSMSPVPSPPKTAPLKKKKINPKTVALSQHRKLPSIGKRSEPEGEDSKDNSSEIHANANERHVVIEKEDSSQSSDLSPRNSSHHSDKSIKETIIPKTPDEKSYEDIIRNFMDGSPMQPVLNTEEADGNKKSGSTSIPFEDSPVEDDKNVSIHSDQNNLITNHSPTPQDQENRTSPLSLTSRSNSNISNKSEDSDSASSHHSEDDNDDGSNHSANESEEEEEVAKKVTGPKEQQQDNNIKEFTEATAIDKNQNINAEQETNTSDIIDILEVIEKKGDESSVEEVYTERITKVFNDSDEINEFYDIDKKLGDGNFAIVHKATDKNNNKDFAMKIIDAAKMEGKLAMLNNEIKIQRSCAHPNIVQLYHDMHSPTKIYLIMELITGGDFFDLIASNVSFEEEEASMYMRDLCSGLDYLHQRDIVHRDIKPENLMVYENNGQIALKIADFGLAMKVTSPIFTICGTPTYVAPEILTEEGYGLEVDVWAAGIILYIMLCGFPPFRSPNRKQTELFDMIEKGEFEFLEPYWDDVSSGAKDLISKILVVNKKERLTARQVFDHEWLLQFRLYRNNTLLDITPRKINRFKTTAKGVQSIQRMKILLGAKLEREQFITPHVNDNETNGNDKSD